MGALGYYTVSRLTSFPRSGELRPTGPSSQPLPSEGQGWGEGGQTRGLDRIYLVYCSQNPMDKIWNKAYAAPSMDPKPWR